MTNKIRRNSTSSTIASSTKGQTDFLQHFDKIPDTKIVENWLLSIDDETTKLEEAAADQHDTSPVIYAELDDKSSASKQSRQRLESEDSNKNGSKGENSELTYQNTQHNSNPQFTNEGDSIRRENVASLGFQQIHSSNESIIEPKRMMMVACAAAAEPNYSAETDQRVLEPSTRGDRLCVR